MAMYKTKVYPNAEILKNFKKKIWIKLSYCKYCNQMQKNYSQGLNYQGKKLRLNQLPDPTLFMIIAVFLLCFIFVWVYFHFSFSPSLLRNSLRSLCFGCVVCGGSKIFITSCLLPIGGSNVGGTLWWWEFSRPASLSFHISIC